MADLSMALPDATADWAPGHAVSTTPLASVSATLDEAPEAMDPGCTWPPKTTHLQRSQAVAAKKSSNTARVRPMHEPQTGDAPHLVLQRLRAMPTACGSAMYSPHRRCSAASASIVAMVHSPRAFANDNNNSVAKRDTSAQTAPVRWFSPMFPTTEFGRSSRCSSPIPVGPTGHVPDHPIPSDEEEDESEDEVCTLRQQVALLTKSLEDEKKRRASEQHLMQTKIIELQSLIRANEHEDSRETESADAGKKTTSPVQEGLIATRENQLLENGQTKRRSPPAESSSSCSCQHKSNDKTVEAAATLQFTRIRAKMHAIVIDSQRETQTLQARLEGVKRTQNEREKRLTLETTIKVTILEQKHAAASTRLEQQAVNSEAQAKKLQAEKTELLAYVQAQRQRLKQLELALGCKQLMDDLR